MLKSDGDFVKAEVVAETNAFGTSITLYTRGNKKSTNAITNIIKGYFAKKGLIDSDYSASEENCKQKGIFDEVSIEARSEEGEKAVRQLAKYLSQNKVFGFRISEYIFSKSKFKRRARY